MPIEMERWVQILIQHPLNLLLDIENNENNLHNTKYNNKTKLNKNVGKDPNN
jgi:hypothetical protein